MSARHLLASLRAADRGDPMPSTKMTIGGRSFRIAAPTVWYSTAPCAINLSANDNFDQGKNRLFNLAYE